MSAIETVFNEPTLSRYREYLAIVPPPPQAAHLRWLYDTLTAHGPAPSDPELARELKRLRARRAAFEAYVETASICGLLDANLAERLRSVEEDNFRAALAECLACWLFAGPLRYKVSPRPGGRAKKELEFTVEAPQDTFAVEVKAPAVAPPKGNVWSGDDTKVIESALKGAAGQFAKGVKNLLVIVPSIRTSVWNRREQIVKALIGESVISVWVSLEGGPGHSEPGFKPNGRMVRPGKQLQDGSSLPAHTRVSAVMTVEVVEVEKAALLPPPTGTAEEKFQAYLDRSLSPDNEFWPECRVLVVHNPFAELPLGENTFSKFPQLVRRGEDQMVWTDRLPEDGGT